MRAVLTGRKQRINDISMDGNRETLTPHKQRMGWKKKREEAQKRKIYGNSKKKAGIHPLEKRGEYIDACPNQHGKRR